MKTGLEDMNTQRKALQDADDKKLPPNHPDRVLAQQKLDAARRLHDDAYRKYLAFAEEIDARQVGDSTAVAVKERLGHQRSVEKARVAEREAYAAYERAMAALTAGGPTNPYRRGLRQQKLKEALETWKKALEKMQRFEQNLANLTAPKAATKSGGAGAGTGSP